MMGMSTLRTTSAEFSSNALLRGSLQPSSARLCLRWDNLPLSVRSIGDLGMAMVSQLLKHEKLRFHWRHGICKETKGSKTGAVPRIGEHLWMSVTGHSSLQISCGPGWLYYDFCS